MKSRHIFLLILGVIFSLAGGCNQQKGNSSASAEDIISAKTLGLAYLEESKLEEAEAEFLKLIEMDPDEVMGFANLGIVYLRMGSFEKAENWLRKAIKMQPEDPDVRLILAKVYEMSGNSEDAVGELEKIMEFSPGHVKSLYNLTELYASIPGEGSVLKRLEYTRILVEKVPGNIVPRLNLVEILIGEGSAVEAREQLEQIEQVFPEFPKEAVEYFNQSQVGLKSGDATAASTPFMIFHNYLKVTTPYQAGMMDLKGPGGALVGSPVVTFDQQQMGFQAADWESVLAAIKFTDITSTAGLDFLLAGGGEGSVAVAGRTHVTACDFDGDGDVDLYAGRYDPVRQSYKHYLLRNEWGVYQDMTNESGITHQDAEFSARFADFDNDGFLDLYVVTEGSNLLYRNTGDGHFEDVSDDAKVGDRQAGNGSLFMDYDHDGDLDLFVYRSGTNLVYRNNSDGSFLEQGARSGLSGGNVITFDAGFGDFDEDGDLDLFVVNGETTSRLYSNQRQGVFQDVTEASGMAHIEGASAVAVGDYNNDGFLDIFIASSTAGSSGLYLNQGDGQFKHDDVSVDVTKSLKEVKAFDATFLDFDNDGFLDLLVAGESVRAGEKGVFLYHADGNGKFWHSPGILPEDLSSGNGITTFDYNDDGDVDLAITGLNGTIRLLRNDGGNNHHFIKMKLVGLRAGSAKNNYFGIGAKVEVRSGSLYQSMVVTEPNIHFGLGAREKAEVIRILWTNGVPQNMFFPATNQDLIEEQQLKGSCPFMYSWNGEEYIFVKDIMWKSALGMPLGIMGESAEYAPAGASVDYIKIPGEQLKLKDNMYNIQVTCELWEAIYMDKIELVVLDHPDSVDVYVDERMGPPSTSGYRLFQVGEKHTPLSAMDHHGADLLPLIAEEDDRYTAGFAHGRYQGVTKMSELILDPGEVEEGQELFLYLRGWIFPSDASINASISQSDDVTMFPPVIETLNEKGEWQLVDQLSFPMGKDKTLITDLTGKVSPSDPRIRIRTNMQLYWDHAFFTKGNADGPVLSFTLKPSAADLHYRGFSRPYRKGGSHGPHWFEYASTTTNQKWRDLEGYYTRFGDVLPLLLEADDQYIIKNGGDETSIEFSAGSLPQVQPGWKRDFLIHSVGWVKDGDLNTARGQRVGPLPFHGMTRYPYGDDESYPDDQEHQNYLRKYNTRSVTTEAFRQAVRETSSHSEQN